MSGILEWSNYIIQWLVYMVKSIIYFFDVLITDMQELLVNTVSYFTLFKMFFDALPAEIMYVFYLGVLLVIILAILRRN